MKGSLRIPAGAVKNKPAVKALKRLPNWLIVELCERQSGLGYRAAAGGAVVGTEVFLELV